MAVKMQRSVISLVNQIVQLSVLGRHIEFNDCLVEVIDDGSSCTTIEETILPVLHVNGRVWRVCDNTNLIVQFQKERYNAESEENDNDLFDSDLFDEEEADDDDAVEDRKTRRARSRTAPWHRRKR